MMYIYIVAAVCVFIILFFRLLGYIVIYTNFRRRISKKKYQEDVSCFDHEGIDIERQYIESKAGRLQTYLFHRKQLNRNTRVVILVNGHGCFAADYKKVIISLVNEGFDIFNFDVSGTGESEGEFPGGYQQWIADLKDVLHYVAPSYQTISFLGHSIGGYAASAILSIADVPIKSAAVVSAINSGTEYARFLYNSIPCRITHQVYDAMRKYETTRYGEYADLTGLKGVNAFGGPVLILHSTEDRMVPLKCSIAGYKDDITNPAATVKCLKKGDHYLLNDDGVVEEIVQFFEHQ